MTTAVYLFTSSLQDLLRPQRFAFWALAGLIMAGLGQAFLRMGKNAVPAEVYVQVSDQILFRILALVAAVFAGVVVNREVQQKTIVYLLTRPVPRGTLLITRWLASAAAVAIVGWIAAAGTALGTTAGFGDVFFRDILALTIGAFAYTALFLMVSLLINKAMVVCLVFAFGWESAVPNMSGSLYLLTIKTHLFGIANHPKPANGASGDATSALASASNPAVPAGTAWIAMLTLVIVLTLFNAQWFGRNEYVPREDGE